MKEPEQRPEAEQRSEEEQTNRPTAGGVEERTAGGVEVDGRRIRGLIPYGVESRDLGGWREIIEAGALRNTDISELRAVIDHKGVPLGRYPNTLDVEDSDSGMRWSLDPPKSRQDVVEAVERGDMRAGSWRMVVAKDEWRGDVRHVHEISELLDVTLVGAEQPAYPSAAVEYRSAPRVTNEPEPNNDGAQERQREDTVDTPEERSAEERSNESKGGLNVEDRKVEVRSKGLLGEVADFAQDVKKGEARALSTAISLSNPEYGDSLFDLMRPISAYLRSGVRTLSTDSDSVIYPMLTADPTPGWYAEAGTIAPSDPTFAAGTVVPHKLAVIIRYSNEVASDSVPGLEGVLRSSLASRGAISIDTAAFQGSGVGAEPLGMGNQPGVPTVNASSLSTGGILWAGTAISTLEANAAPRPYAYVGAANLTRRLREVRVDTGGNVGPFLYPPTSEEVPPIWGAQGFVAPHLAAGTAYFFSPSQCYVVNRTSGFEIEIDRSRLFNSDESEMRLKARLDFFFPYSGSSGAVVKGTAVPA